MYALQKGTGPWEQGCCSRLGDDVDRGLAGPASAKVESITEATITGPGADGGLRIEAPDTEGLLKSGIDMAGGLNGTRADSVGGLGLNPAHLGPKYLVIFRFDRGDDLIRQDLYPLREGRAGHAYAAGTGANARRSCPGSQDPDDCR